MMYTKDMTRYILNSIIDERCSNLADNGILSIDYKQYEENIKRVLSNYSNGRYTNIKYTGRKSVCCDLILYDTVTQKQIALQIKSNNISGKFTKIYQMNKITEILIPCDTALEVLKEIIDFYNARYKKEKDKYGFDELQSLLIVKGHSAAFLYENHFNLNEFDEDLTKYQITRYKKGSYLWFTYGDREYKFTFSNHTLYVDFICGHDYIDSIATTKLKTYSEKAIVIVDDIVKNNIDSTESIPFVDKFYTHRNYLAELARLMTSQSSELSYDDSEITRIAKTDIMYINNKSGVFLLKDSVIKNTSKMYAELLKINAISKKGRVLVNLRVSGKTDLTKYFK